MNDSHDKATRIVQEIAGADSAAPSMIAIQLAVSMVMSRPTSFSEPDADDGDMQGWERAALVSAYRAAVKSGGFDPVAEWLATPGV